MNLRTPNTRSALVVACLALFACNERIQQGLDERQANEVQTVLLEHGFDARKVMAPGKKPTWAIEVPDEQASDAIRILNKEQLPRPAPPDPMESGGLVPTPTEERTRLMAHLAAEIAQTLETVDGVSTARVHVVLAPPPRPGQAPGPSKASAFLRVRKEALPRVNGLKEDLRELVAGSVENLDAADVALVVTEVVHSVPRPAPGPSSHLRTRWLVVVLGGALSALAVLLVILTFRLRHYRSLAERPAPPATSPPRPVVSPSVARKVA